MSSVQSPISSRCGPGHITLESLLDSPGLTPSPLSESLNESGIYDSIVPSLRSTNALAHAPSDLCKEVPTRRLFDNEAHRQAVLRDYCIELLFVLRNQDSNGYFLSCVPGYGNTMDASLVGLLDLEKRLRSGGYNTLHAFKSDVSQLFASALRYYPLDTPAHSEAERLQALASNWFASLSVEFVDALNTETPKEQPSHQPVLSEVANNEFPRETSLRVLNPDNRGILSISERIRSIGEEVGPLLTGSYLLPNGGYREDRRNKVVPYTYLDYGPYYSFAPRYDSGASHCSPEAHQLILGTSWFPARTAFLAHESPPPEVESDASDTDDVSLSLRNDAVRSALAIGDHQLAVSLAVADIEQRTTERLAADLDMILPGPEVSEDCVFSMCLANAFTIDLLRDEKRLMAPLSPGESYPKCTYASTDVSHSSLKGGDDLVCLDSGETTEVPSDTTEMSTYRELSESANDLLLLYRAQYRRLGDTSQNATMSGSTLMPSQHETAAAHRLVRRLIGLSKRVRPRDLVHPYAVRKAMGMDPNIAPLPDDYDMDAGPPRLPDQVDGLRNPLTLNAAT